MRPPEPHSDRIRKEIEHLDKHMLFPIACLVQGKKLLWWPNSRFVSCVVLCWWVTILDTTIHDTMMRNNCSLRYNLLGGPCQDRDGDQFTVALLCTLTPCVKSVTLQTMLAEFFVMYNIVLCLFPISW